MVTSWTLPWLTAVMKSEKLMSRSFMGLVLMCTTCQSRTPNSRITSQKTTCFAVEFTKNSCVYGERRGATKSMSRTCWLDALRPLTIYVFRPQLQNCNRFRGRFLGDLVVV